MAKIFIKIRYFSMSYARKDVFFVNTMYILNNFISPSKLVAQSNTTKQTQTNLTNTDIDIGLQNYNMPYF